MISNKFRTTNFFTTLLCLVFVGCASHMSDKPVVAPPPMADNDKLKISYVLGQNEYAFTAEAKNDGNYKISSLLNEKLIEAKPISKEQYLNFADKVTHFADQFSRQPQQTSEECRTPFYIEISTSQKKTEIEGCRKEDTEGQLGRLIRDGEILFYRK